MAIGAAAAHCGEGQWGSYPYWHADGIVRQDSYGSTIAAGRW